MEDHGKNLALFQQIQCFSTPHRHLIGEYPVHLPALSGQVRVHIALQGDVGVGVSQQFAEGLYIAPRLQAGRCKGVPLRYNNDKQKKPLFSRGLSVCRLLFNSFSKLKIDENYKEKRRLFY